MLILKGDFFSRLLGFIILLFLFGCMHPPENPNEPVITIELTQIIDEATQKPIPNNTITLQWETEDGEIIDKQEYFNKQTLTTSTPADGKTRSLIIVTAPGYQPWENAIRVKLNENRPIEITVNNETYGTLRASGIED